MAGGGGKVESKQEDRYAENHADRILSGTLKPKVYQDMYEIEFSAKARRDLDWFKKSERNEILDGIELNLVYEPNIETRNRKRLRPNETAEWELRLGKYRVFYDVEETVLIVSIEAIGLKLGNTFYFQGKEEEL